jgi:hypothetical protein
MKPARMSCLFFALMVGVSARADTPDFLKGRPPMSKETRLQIIRLLQAELAFTRKVFPQGEKGLVIDPSGTIKPDNQELAFAVANQGVAARAGDRVQITNVFIKDHDILFEINGGPKKKLKWYQRVQVSGMGGTTSAPVDAEKLNARGSYLDLAFSKHVPEMNLEELKKLLSPVFDFTAKSAAQAYIETLPPKLQDAIKNHKVLVGMNREMVTEAMGRPPKRVREKENGVEYEEWIYGEAPADVQFVRFVGDEVVQLKIMPVGAEKIVRTEKEIQVNPQTGAATLASAGGAPAPPAGPEQTATAEKPPKKTASKPPTLRRPGEEPPPEAPAPGAPMPRKTDPNGTPGSWPDPSTGTGVPLPPGSEPGTIPKL